MPTSQKVKLSNGFLISTKRFFDRLPNVGPIKRRMHSRATERLFDRSADAAVYHKMSNRTGEPAAGDPVQIGKLFFDHYLYKIKIDS